MLNRLFRRLAVKMGLDYFGDQIRAAAEGRLGAEWKARYWAVAGKKTWSGCGLALLAATLVALGYNEAATAVGVAAGLLIQWGLVDKAWRSEVPAFVKDSGVYRFLASHSADVAVILGLIYADLQKAACGHQCDVASQVVLVVGAAFVQLAILDPAWRAHPPRLESLWPSERGGER
jgi:hypothetical protein